MTTCSYCVALTRLNRLPQTLQAIALGQGGHPRGLQSPLRRGVTRNGHAKELLGRSGLRRTSYSTSIIAGAAIARNGIVSGIVVVRWRGVGHEDLRRAAARAFIPIEDRLQKGVHRVGVDLAGQSGRRMAETRL